ncbi:MAG: hypothetical protein JOZ45_02040, partial [Acidobacteriaceae bacterium]|nr:hypothetical protein [Acidobacteriaceae bacterium]
VNCLHVTRKGELWVGTNNGLYRFENGRFVSVLPGVNSEIHEAADGHLLIVANGRLVEWNGTGFVEHPDFAQKLGVGAQDFMDVIQDRHGTTWICTLGGLVKSEKGDLCKFYFYGQAKRPVGAHRAYEDHQGNMWIEFRGGLYRISAAKPGSRELLVQSATRAIYSDRDGDLWVGTNGDGLLRFKDRLVTMFTKESGLPNDTTMTVLSRRDGSLWVGSNCGGLSVFDRRRFRVYTEKDGLTNSCVWALAEDAQNNLWIGTWGGGIFRLKDKRFAQFSKLQGLADNVVRGLTVAQDDSLWIATNAGVSHFFNGQFHNYTTREGLSSNRVLAVHQDRRGRIWAATSSAIDRFTGERFVPVTPPGKIVDPQSIQFAEDAAGHLYAIGAPRGIDLIREDHLVNVSQNLELFGMTVVGQDFWFSGVKGVFRFAAKTLTINKERDMPMDYTSFGIPDGMNTTQCSVGNPNMAVTREGKLWVATVKGLAELDPHQLPVDRSKPAIWVAEVTVGRVKQMGGRELILPPGAHHTELHFDSISLKSPEKVKFQYRMDDIDPVWLDADHSLTAVYTNIPIGQHLFHVRACNSNGIWDPVGIVYRVTQQPYFYETNWFRLGIVIFMMLLLAGAYQWRLKQITHQYNIRLEERVNERTRIARELHDTLLQSFQGLLFRFEAIRRLIPDRPQEALQAMDRALEQADQSVNEGREAIQGLRATDRNDLAGALSELGEELAANYAQPVAPSFQVTVEGTPHTLNAIFHDEVYRIAAESIRNAFQHARARRIEAELGFSDRLFWVRVRDDGQGIRPDILHAGDRGGHFGLTGMRERAQQLGGSLEIWSEIGAGTEIEFKISGSLAFDHHRRRAHEPEARTR